MRALSSVLLLDYWTPWVRVRRGVTPPASHTNQRTYHETKRMTPTGQQPYLDKAVAAYWQCCSRFQQAGDAFRALSWADMTAGKRVSSFVL